jgi:hypothetical protein
MTKKNTVEVEVGELDMNSSLLIIDAIAKLQAALELFPIEHRHAATVSFEAYDWEGVKLSYIRDQTPEEWAEVVARDAVGDRIEWIRRIRVALGLSKEDAEAAAINRPDVVQYHPKYEPPTSA